MTPKLPILAALAVSTAGHDKGRAYLIVKVIDHEFVAVADGEYRGLKAPKKKRLKHLHLMPAQAFDSGMLEKIIDGTLKDNELKRYLLKCNNAVMQ